MPRMPSEKVLKQRKFFLVAEDGRRLDVVARIASLGGQHPYFSITSQNGSNHEEMLAAMPELAPLVTMHLCDSATGFPMHAVANLAYYLQNQDFETAHRHVGKAVAIEDLMVLAGKASMEKAKVTDAAQQTLLADRARLQREFDRLDERQRQAKIDGRTFFAGKDLAKAEQELAAVAKDEHVEKLAAATGRKAYDEMVSAFLVERCAVAWKERMLAVEAQLDAPDYVAEGYVAAIEDPTTYAGFIKAHGLEFRAFSPTSGGNGRNQWACRFVSSRNSFSFPFTQAIDAGEPDPARVLQCLQLDAQCGGQTFSEWADEFGLSEDSLEAHRTHNACVNTHLALKELLGEDAFSDLMERCGEDLPIRGVDPSTGEPSSSFAP